MSTIDSHLQAPRAAATAGKSAIAHQQGKFIFWGTTSLFSSNLLAELGRRMRPQAIMLPGPVDQDRAVARLAAPASQPMDRDLLLHPQYVTHTPISLGWQWGVPVYTLRNLRASAVQRLLRDLAPDVVCVACFPWRIPPSLLAIPTHGFVNLHPSRLPAYRGPAPLFWQLRAGEQQSGVTLHRMDADFDHGAILAQQSLALPNGANSAELDRQHAAAAVTLLQSYLQQLVAGNCVTGTPQYGSSSYQSWPQPQDFTLDRQWSARHAFAFMRGTDEWQQPYRLDADNHVYGLRHALAFDPIENLPTAVQQTATGLAIQFTPGVLYATLA